MPEFRPSRREVLRLLAAAAALPACKAPGGGPAPATKPWPRFFSDAERRALGALADAVLPPDGGPGGQALGAVPYIERLLTAFEFADTPIYADGPYSGRSPLPGDDGGPGAEPADPAFSRAAPLDRVTERAWRLHLYGSDGVEGGGPNDAALGKVVGLRDRVRAGLQKAMVASPAPLESLDAAALARAFAALDADFQDLLIELVPQGAFGAPEYGGNPGGQGWTLVHYEGDVMPVGYSWFDPQLGDYRERPDAPVSTPNPQPDPEPMDDHTRQFLSDVIHALGGREFA